jgi:CBS domain containing-hemolysin-like protein
MESPTSHAFIVALGGEARRIAVVVLCLLVIALASLAEAALVRVELSRVRQLAEEGRRRGAARLAHLVAQRQEVLSSLLVLINLSVILASAYTTDVTIRLSDGSARWVPLTSLAMIVFILMFCEVTPKTFSVGRAEAVALATAPLVGVLHTLVRPLGRVLHAIAAWIIRHVVVPMIGGEVTSKWPRYTDEEVMELVAAGEAGGSVEEEERDMIEGVIEFADKVVREVMTPRTDMVTLPATATLAEAARVSQDTGYSRLPVYEDDADHIIGIVYAKDLVSALQSDGADDTAGEIARKPAPVVPESKKLHEAFQFMQRNRFHMVIVIDEYGGTAGLATIEDLIEEIFGEIRDEYDVGGEPVRVVDENTLLVDGRVSTGEVEEALEVKLPAGEYDSIGGLILDLLGRLPEAGEKVTWKGLEFTVEAVSENRVHLVRIARTPEESSDEGVTEGTGGLE